MPPVLWTIVFTSRRRHTRFDCDWSSDVCSSDLAMLDYVEIDSVAVSCVLREDFVIRNTSGYQPKRTLQWQNLLSVSNCYDESGSFQGLPRMTWSPSTISWWKSAIGKAPKSFTREARETHFSSSRQGASRHRQRTTRGAKRS